jgi:hypothetical protein
MLIVGEMKSIIYVASFFFYTEISTTTKSEDLALACLFIHELVIIVLFLVTVEIKIIYFIVSWI